MGTERLAREHRTVEAMIRLWCEKHHGGRPLCPECEDLLSYARSRLEKCPFQESKPTCGRCSVHCYKPEMRDRIREVMRYAGPRMLGRHPRLAAAHLLDRFRRSEGREK